MRKFLLTGAALCVLGASSVITSEAPAASQCILPGTTDLSGNLVSPGGPCNGNNGFGNGTDAQCTLQETSSGSGIFQTVCVGGATGDPGPDKPPGNSGPKGPNR